MQESEFNNCLLNYYNIMITTSMVKAFFTITALVAVYQIKALNATLVDDTILKVHYETIFGERVLDSCHSLLTLRHAHDLAMSYSVHENSITFSCFDYLRGQEIASLHRAQHHDEVALPILVDDSNDLMCFAIFKASQETSDEIVVDDGTSDALFTVSNPTALKVHPSIYHSVEVEEPLWLDIDLSIMFVPEYHEDVNIDEIVDEEEDNEDQEVGTGREGRSSEHDISEDAEEDFGASKAHFQKTVNSLIAYSLAPYDRFFWTSSAAPPYASTSTTRRAAAKEEEEVVVVVRVEEDDDDEGREYADAGADRDGSAAQEEPPPGQRSREHLREHEQDQDQYDLHRAELWQRRRLYLEGSLQQGDVCHYRQLLESAEYFPGKITLSLDALATTVGDPALQMACLSHLTATFAVDPSVTLVAITERTQLLNFRARSIQQSATASRRMEASPYTEMGLRGGSQVVTVTDTGVDVESCYFYDPKGAVAPSTLSNPSFDKSYRKIIQYNYNGCGDKSDEYAGHGTHVSGTVMGSIDNANIATVGKYDGVAPDAKLSVVDLAKPGTGLCIPPAKTLYTPGHKAGSRVNSNSWGSYFNGGGYYDSQDVDRYLYKRRRALILFAAGNAGQNGDETLTRQASGKNSVAVGSSESTLGGPNITYVAFYSSKGPTYDKRIKPDLVAPGDSLMSVRSNGDGSRSCATQSMSGTSMATPAAAGAALLIREYFSTSVAGFWTSMCSSAYLFCRRFTPSGVLTKALLIHSGTAMTLYHGGGPQDIPLGAPPDYLQGYGRVTLMNILPLLQGQNDRMDLFVEDLVSIKEDSTITYVVVVTQSKIPLKVTLAWYDPPSVGGSTTKALLENLDLLLVAPSGKKYYGNGGTSPDKLNTNEQILIQKPKTGNWKLMVSAKALPKSGKQKYSLSVTSGGSVDASYVSQEKFKDEKIGRREVVPVGTVGIQPTEEVIQQAK